MVPLTAFSKSVVAVVSSVCGPRFFVATVMDVPEIVVRFTDRPDRRANNLGAKGLGEPPIIPTAAAVANAVANAIGVRLRHAPMTPARVLEALAVAR